VPILVATELNKSYGALHVLDGISLSIDQGERVGLVGINGSGKTTLARIVGGADVADSGSVASPRDSKVAYLAQAVDLPATRTARQVVMSGLTEWDEARARHEHLSEAIRRGDGDLTQLVERQAAAAADVERLGGWNRMHQVDSILGHIGLSQLDTPVDALSGGDRRRVALARILVSEPDLAVLDEPSNHLDVDTVAWLERFLVETYRGALLMITHDRYLLDRVVTRTLEIEHGRLHSYPGGYESYLEAKAERLLLEARTEANRQNFLRRELEWLRRQPKARTGKQKARIQRAEDTVAERPLSQERTAKLAIDGLRSGKTILELHDVGLQMGGRTLGSDIALIVNPGDRIGIVGPNGVGKTTLLRCILGEIEPSAGKVVLGKNTRVAYFDQHRSDLDLEESVFENVAGPRSHVDLGGRSVDVHAYLERFLFTGLQMRQPVKGLSGGERARVALAKLLSHGANLLVLDEPTNDLDVATLGALEELLLEFDGCAIVVTHDRWFLNRVATSILSFEGDGKVVLYAGNYDAYRLQRERREEEQEKERPVEAKPARVVVEKRSKGLTYAERIELEGLIDRIAQAEEEVATLERELSDPGLYASRGKEVPVLHGRLAEAKQRADTLTARWEELEVKREESARKV
jgi:ATP-binding cassette subfamily F protein uup